ncbi:MAG TPA: sulfatase-like hydrolase/transferase [Candidatus Saccharimonadales bacterium]|nr:sulfatase-like hydrolase/transferase [Candidatus Saccharimonadales bacterium]
MSQHKKASHQNELKHRSYRRWLRFAADNTPAAEIVFISTFILIRWWNNSDFSYFTEVFVPIMLFGALASVIFYIYRLILGRGIGAHIAALILIYLFYIFQFVENSRLGKTVYDILPGFLSSAFSRSVLLALVLGLFCGLLAWAVVWVFERYDTLKRIQPYKVLLFTIAFIFLFQLYRTGSRLYELRHQLTYRPPAVNIQPSAAAAARKPDIYYFVFDRYNSPVSLKENFNFDNSDIVNFLGRQGFTTRQNAFSNYPFTMSSISSTLRMDYYPDYQKMFGGQGNWQSAAPYRRVLSNPPLAQILSKQGYTYNQVSSWWDFTRLNIEADNHPTQSFRLRILNKNLFQSDLQRDIINKSILSPWLKKGLAFGNFGLLKYDLDRNPAENFEAQMKAIGEIAGRADKDSPQFTFAHILAPHPPYVFDQNGNPPPYDNESNDNGVDEKVKYTNEMTYINKRMKEMVSNITRQSPDAVIVIQADEGPYPKQFRGPMSPSHYYDPINLPDQMMKQKFGIMASYRMPGLTTDEIQQADSSVNVFRVILDNYLGYELPVLPDCHFATGTKFDIYTYTLVNDRLMGGPNPDECKQYE